MAYSPMVKDWALYFDRIHGYDNRFTVIKAFADFLDDAEAIKLQIPGKCMLGGRVFGHPKFIEGEDIFTSDIKTIEKIERNHDHKNSIPHDIMCANTASGSKYYFYSDEQNAYMVLMLGDMTHLGRLSPCRYYYLSRKFRGSKLL